MIEITSNFHPRRNPVRRMAVTVLLVVLIFPALLMAAGHVGLEHELPSFKQFLKLLLPYWVNFLIYVGALYFLLRKPARRAWQGRRAAIQKHVAEAAGLLMAAERNLAAIEAKVSELPEALKSLRCEIERETEAEVAAILAEAQQRAEGIVRQAEESGLAERKFAERIARGEIVGLAMERARAKLQDEVTPQLDRSLRLAACQAVGELVQ